MIDSERWMREWVRRMCDAFGSRLKYLGLQGSYRRGEAHEASDIDVVTILDRVQTEDFRTIRRLREGMPEQDKACGFLAGEDELRAWPRHELFQFHMDTDDYYGSLSALLPPLTEEDIRAGLRIQVSGLYHMTCHTQLYGAPETQTDILRSLYKSVYFALALACYLETGVYFRTKRELASQLQGQEAALLAISRDFDGAAPSIDARFDLLRDWCSDMLKNLA